MVGTRVDEAPACFLLLPVEHVHPAQGLSLAYPTEVHLCGFEAADMKVHLTDTSAADGYPIAGFTFILLYKDQKYGEKTMEKAKTVVNLVWWMIHDGQKHAGNSSTTRRFHGVRKKRLRSCWSPSLTAALPC
jgi:hypothetical protein